MQRAQKSFNDILKSRPAERCQSPIFARVSQETKITIWITGADGQLGQCLKYVLQNHPWINGIFTRRTEIDLSNPEEVKSWITEHAVDAVINAAAYTAVDKAGDEPEAAIHANADIPQILATVCAPHAIPLLHISTDYVFDGTASEPYRETDVENPQSQYGLSKYLGEQEVLQASKRNMIVRTSWLYSEYGHNFVKTMLRLGREKEQINVVNDQVGAPTYAGHLAEALVTMVEKVISERETDFGGVYHFSNSGTATWFDLATAVMEIKGLPCTVNPCTTAEYPTKAARPAYSVLQTQKIQSIFDLQIANWKEALREALSKMPDS